MAAGQQKALEIFRKNGGMMRTAEAIAAGVHPATLYAMRDKGDIGLVARGLYRLAEKRSLENPDLTAVCRKIPGAVVCLVSALSFHGLTTQIPRVVHIAVGRRSRTPTLDFPPIKVYRFTGESFSKGVEIHRIDDTDIKVFCPEKTIADCFKFRNKIGMDIVLEAIKLYSERGDTGREIRMDDLFRYARICRVEQVMKPYLEALF